MILHRDKRPKQLKLHRWFAWYPVWAWSNKEYEILNLVWLQNVWRTNGYTVKYRYYIELNNKQ